MRINMFKVPKHNVFEYKPRYYDPDKEDLEERIAQAKREIGVYDENEKQSDRKRRIKGQMRRQYHQERLSRSNKQSNLRLILIIAVLGFLAYLVLYTNVEVLFF
ncbi:MAG: hypothetical protein CSA05_00785 [Bacteroidia bacterium]|nr:MAG: hypothetical protein CSA05_00785 [Bacteroidia bacterium]